MADVVWADKDRKERGTLQEGQVVTRQGARGGKQREAMAETGRPASIH